MGLVTTIILVTYKIILDLFVTNVGQYTKQNQGRGGYYEAYPDAFAGHLFPQRTEYSVLYRGLGSGRFKDVTQETGLRDGSWSGDCSFADVNQDGFMDLYIVNMQGDDHFYENQQRYSNIPEIMWVHKKQCSILQFL